MRLQVVVQNGRRHVDHTESLCKTMHLPTVHVGPPAVQA